MPDERLRTHERAIEVVGAELSRRGFAFDPPKGRSGETIRVTSRYGKPLACQVKVHADTQGNPWILARHAGVPVDPNYYVVLVNLRQYYLPQFYVLTNEEARDLYVLDEGNVAHYDIEDLRADPEGFEKIGARPAGLVTAGATSESAGRPAR